jgi:hypothetical protein
VIGGEQDSHPLSKARSTLEAIRIAYENQDMEAILQKVEPRFYPDVSRLRRALYEDREQISQVRLEFHINQEIADGTDALLKVRWNRVHTVNATGASVRASGVAEFQFRKKDGLLIDMRSARGGLPLGFN